MVCLSSMMNSSHWENTYSSKAVHERSWSESGISDSLSELIASEISKQDTIIDIGGGSSTFVDSLLSDGFEHVSVLDISRTAINEAQRRTGSMGTRVSWIVEDVLAWKPLTKFDYWNDRAVFHFLIDPIDQRKYVDQVREATKSGSHIVIATFSPDGPEACSGLPVQRWSAQQLSALFADFCTVVSHTDYKHVTPWGSSQSFMRLHVKRN